MRRHLRDCLFVLWVIIREALAFIAFLVVCFWVFWQIHFFYLLLVYPDGVRVTLFTRWRPW